MSGIYIVMASIKIKHFLFAALFWELLVIFEHNLYSCFSAWVIILFTIFAILIQEAMPNQMSGGREQQDPAANDPILRAALTGTALISSILSSVWNAMRRPPPRE